MARQALSKAARLLRARRYSEAISLLEPQVFMYRENFTFYSLLGTACLYAGDFGGAYSYLQRAYQLNRQDVGTLLGLAAVHLRRRQVTEALNHWLQVLDHDPRNKIARKGLSLVRSTDDPSEYVTMAESGKLTKFYPSVGLRVPPLAIVIVAAVVLGSGIAVTWPEISGLFARQPAASRAGSELVELQPDEERTDFEGDFRYVLEPDEVQDTFEQVGKLFNEFRDNLAQREANRLLNSNASDLVKERVRLVQEYFRTPTFVDFRDNFTFSDVAGEPWLYDGCYVRWTGQVSNLSSDDSTIRFTLLVGYEDERILEGTVPVTVPFAADVQPGPIELIGRVEHRDGDVSLTASSIRRIAPGN